MSNNHPSNDQTSDLAREIDAASKATDLHEHDDASRLGRAVNLVAEIAGVLVFATIVLLVFLNAAGRYTISATFVWGDEVVLGLLPWLGMLGMFLSIRRRQIIRIDFFASLLPPLVRSVLEVLTTALAAGAFFYLAMISFEYFQLFGGDRTIYLRLQKGWFMSAMVIGPALAACAYIVLMITDVRRRRSR
jgi:TRAP-type C4-dicarboxylate transport system permease small subunit